jgi:hypothetical protein
MSAQDARSAIEFGEPATYRIVVQGALNSCWRDRLAGLAISTTSGSGGLPRTTLFGRIRDQAELSGVLDTLYGLHLPILSVETIDDAG